MINRNTQILLFIILGLNVNLAGQNLFRKIYSESINPEFYAESTLILLPDSGYAYIGTRYISGVNYSLFGRLDKNGGILWTKQLQNDNSNNCYAGITVTPTSFIYITYPTYDPINFVSVSAVMKLDMAGNIIWNRAYGNPNTHMFGKNIFVINNSLYVSGVLGGSNINLTDLFLQKIDSNGNLIFGKTYGGAVFENLQDTRVLKNKDILMCSRAVDSVNVDLLNLIRLDSTGGIKWHRRYKIGLGPFFGGHSTNEDSKENILVTGAIDSLPSIGCGKWDIFLMKLDKSGNRLWSKSYGGANYDEGWSVYPNSDGYTIIAEPESFGNISKTATVKTDTMGNLQWTKLINSSTGCFPNNSVRNKDNGYTVLGTNGSFTNSSNIVLTKIDTLGNSLCQDSLVTLCQNSFTLQYDTLLTSGSISGAFTFTPVVTGNIQTVADYCENINAQNEDFAFSTLRIYPNPTSSVFSLEMTVPAESSVEFRIGGTCGDILFKSKVTTGTFFKEIIDLRDLANGIYFMQIRYGSKEIVRKILKQ